MSAARASSSFVPGRTGGRGDTTARTTVPTVKPRMRNIVAEIKPGRLLRGGGSGCCVWRAIGAVLGLVCWSRSVRDEEEKAWEQGGVRSAAGGRRDVAWYGHAALAALAAARARGRAAAMRHCACWASIEPKRPRADKGGMALSSAAGIWWH